MIYPHTDKKVCVRVQYSIGLARAVLGETLSSTCLVNKMDTHNFCS